MTKKFLWGVFLIAIMASCSEQKGQEKQRPNILWITVEDISPHLGCYGDAYAYTPVLDKMADEGVLFRNAFATASVCTPARSSIITGIYAGSLGTQHLRGQVPLSAKVRCYTEYLREAGYYCINFNKTDYNFEVPPKAWDVNGHMPYDSLIDYLKTLPAGQPFFCVINLKLTHQSRTRYGLDKLNEINGKLPPGARHDPGKAPVPPYYPDTPEVRTNIAALYTQITLMDGEVGTILNELEKSGFSDKTIIFFYSDHGDGLPRHKRWLYYSGTQVPFIIKFPQQYQYLSPVKPGEEVESIINFVDLAPTMLSITGCQIPDMLTGKVFLGPSRKERKYTFAIRDRVDEVYEFSRSVSDGRFQYIRNFACDKPRMQWSNYSEITPIRKELRRLYKAGKLDDKTGWLMQDSKPVEELYDLKADPYEMNNLANDPAYAEKTKELKKVLFDWMADSKDLSLVPEPMMRRLSGNGSPMDAFAGNSMFDFREILAVADRKGRGAGHLEELIQKLTDPSPAVRYWAASCLSIMGNDALPAEKPLKALLKDEFPSVRIAAADALCKAGYCNEAIKVLGESLLDDDIVVRLYAAMSLLDLKEKAAPVKAQINESLDNLPKNVPDSYYLIYIKDALNRIKANI